MPNLSALPKVAPIIVAVLILAAVAWLIAQTTLWSVLGQASLDDLLA